MHPLLSFWILALAVAAGIVHGKLEYDRRHALEDARRVAQPRPPVEREAGAQTPVTPPIAVPDPTPPVAPTDAAQPVTPPVAIPVVDPAAEAAGLEQTRAALRVALLDHVQRSPFLQARQLVRLTEQGQAPRLLDLVAQQAGQWVVRQEDGQVLTIPAGRVAASETIARETFLASLERQVTAARPQARAGDLPALGLYQLALRSARYDRMDLATELLEESLAVDAEFIITTFALERGDELLERWRRDAPAAAPAPDVAQESRAPDAPAPPAPTVSLDVNPDPRPAKAASPKRVSPVLEHPDFRRAVVLLDEGRVVYRNSLTAGNADALLREAKLKFEAAMELLNPLADRFPDDPDLERTMQRLTGLLHACMKRSRI